MGFFFLAFALEQEVHGALTKKVGANGLRAVCTASVFGAKAQMNPFFCP
jgi:hypothetical protein